MKEPLSFGDQQIQTPLPEILAGPMLRRLTQKQIVLWVVTPRQTEMTLCVYRHEDGHCFFSEKIKDIAAEPLQIGLRAFIYLIDYVPSTSFPTNELLEYDLIIHTNQGDKTLKDCIPDLVYKGQERPVFVIKPQLDHVLHGSCRKPHHPSGDAFYGLTRSLQIVSNLKNKDLQCFL